MNTEEVVCVCVCVCVCDCVCVLVCPAGLRQSYVEWGMCIWALVGRKHCKYVEGVSFHVGGAQVTEHEH